MNNLRNMRRCYYIKHPTIAFALVDRKFFGCYFTKNLSPKCYCSFCGERFHNFLIHGYISELSMNNKSTLGLRLSDCPYCGSVDKYRWEWYVLENYLHISQVTNVDVLHFAPEKPIYNRIKQNGSINYMCGDIVPGRADYVVDMTDMQFEDSSFDIIIACNVLEHIQDEKRALTEIKRVLKTDGTFVVMIPVAYDVEETWEDENITSEEERVKYFGQEDHVRLYGNDYQSHFEKYGFIVNALTAEEVFSRENIKKYGLTKVSPILLCKNA